MTEKTYCLTKPSTCKAVNMTQGVYYARCGMVLESSDDPNLAGKLINEKGRERWMPDKLFDSKYTEVV